MTHSENNHSMAGYSMLVVFVLAVLVSGCTLLLGDTVKRDMSKLTHDPCPDLSGKYELGGTVLSAYGLPDKKMVGDIMISYLPTEQENNVDNIYESLFDFNKPYRINFRKEISPTYPRRFDYVLDGNKVKEAYVEFKPTDGNEYIVSVYLSDNHLLGKFQTKLLGANSICHDNKYYTFLQEPSAHMVGDDWAFSTKRSSGEMMFYRSESGALIRENVGRTKVIILGAIPTTQQKSQIIMTFPSIP